MTAAALTRYFLHLRDGTLIGDPDGSELPDLDAARDGALAAARDLWAVAIVKGEDLSDRQFVIANEQGQPVIPRRPPQTIEASML